MSTKNSRTREGPAAFHLRKIRSLQEGGRSAQTASKKASKVKGPKTMLNKIAVITLKAIIIVKQDPSKLYHVNALRHMIQFIHE